MLQAGSRFVRRSWRGELPLYQAFWSWGVSGGLLLGAVLLVPAFRGHVDGVAYLLGAAALVAYTLWALVVIWRAAEHAAREEWVAIVRFLAVAWLINVVLITGFVGLDFALG